MAKSKSEIQRDYEKRTGYQAANKYNKEKTTLFGLRLMHSTDQDIIKKLSTVENKSGYIKQLIREDIAKNA